MVGSAGNVAEVGERDGGGLSLVVALVDGRLWSFTREKALKTGIRGAKFELLSPKLAEFRPANFANEVDGGSPLNIDGLSDENVS